MACVACKFFKVTSCDRVVPPPLRKPEDDGDRHLCLAPHACSSAATASSPCPPPLGGCTSHFSGEAVGGDAEGRVTRGNLLARTGLRCHGWPELCPL